MDIREQWRQLAADLGLEFKEGIEAFLESPTLLSLAGREFQGKDMLQARRLLSSPLAQGLLSRIFMGAASGQRNGREFLLLRRSRGVSSRKGSSLRYDVVVTLLFAHSLDLGLAVTRKGAGSSLGRLLFPGRYLRFGEDAELSSRLTATAKNKAAAADLLATAEMRRACAALFSRPGDFTVTDHCLRYKEPGQIISRRRAEEVMDQLAVAAGHLPDFMTRMEPAGPPAS